MSRDHAIECEHHPGEWFSGFNGPDECPRCVSSQIGIPFWKVPIIATIAWIGGIVVGFMLGKVA